MAGFYRALATHQLLSPGLLDEATGPQGDGPGPGFRPPQYVGPRLRDDDGYGMGGLACGYGGTCTTGGVHHRLRRPQRRELRPGRRAGEHPAELPRPPGTGRLGGRERTGHRGAGHLDPGFCAAPKSATLPRSWTPSPPTISAPAATACTRPRTWPPMSRRRRHRRRSRAPPDGRPGRRRDLAGHPAALVHPRAGCGVHESYRSRGLGAATFSWAIEEARRRGCAGAAHHRQVTTRCPPYLPAVRLRSLPREHEAPPVIRLRRSLPKRWTGPHARMNHVTEHGHWLRFESARRRLPANSP